MKIGIVDTSITGLSFGLLCEKHGYDVIFSHNNDDFIYNLNNRVCITEEPMVQSLLLDSPKFTTTSNVLDVIKESDIIFIFSKTPINLEGNYDTTSVFNIVSSFYTLSSQNVELYNKKLVICSPTNPGEVEQIQTRLNMFNVQVAYNPFFVDGGEIIKNIQKSEMVLIGSEHQELSNELIHIHSKIKTVTVNAYVMSYKAAEIVKLGINTFLSSKINQSNMIGQIAIKSGIESEMGMVLSAIGGFDGIGKKHMSYGLGYGGTSINSGNKAISHYSKSLGLGTKMFSSITEFNESHLKFIKQHYIEKNPTGELTFVFNHLTYKKGVNVLEESQYFKLCIELLDDGYSVNVIETPKIISELNQLSEKYDGRLKFYKPGTYPSGILINL
jgi:nucleotide sugar dehydrogenase